MTDRGERRRLPRSPSQIGTFRECKRKWGWSYLRRLRGEPNKFAELGTKVHAELEAWFRDRKRPNPLSEAGKIAESGLHHWPAPGTRDFHIEAHAVVERDDTAYHGYLDLAWLDPDPDVGAVVGDHKSTTDFKWAKTAEDLRTDLQAAVYARAVMEEFGVDSAELRWVYYRTRGPRKSQVVRLRVLREEVDRTLDAADADYRAIEAIPEDTDPLALPPTVTACANYGGCGYRNLCTDLTPKTRLKGLFAHMSLKEKMAARLAAQKEGTVAAKDPINPPEKAKAPKPKPAPTPPPVEDEVIEAAAPAPSSFARRDLFAVSAMEALIQRDGHLTIESAATCWAWADMMIEAAG